MDDYFFPIIDENINPCRGCPDYDEDGCKSNGGCGSPQTNADRIRAMTDEELVDLYMRAIEDEEYPGWWGNRMGLLLWLKQEVGDGNHDH
jgi:hypothetical protein